jgi:threonine dehydrogenase-like Zn-dependent dehydrogenase
MSKIVAAVMTGPNMNLELRELDEPTLEVDSILMEVRLSEVCGTDVHLKQGRIHDAPYPLIPGHVSVGKIRKLRGSVMDVDGRPLIEGDTISFFDVHQTCSFCWYCDVARASTRCPMRKVYGVTYGLQDGPSGSWAQSIYLKPGTKCIKLSDESCDIFMRGGCSLPTALHANQLANIEFGDSVLVLGSGPVGWSSIICAKLRGAQKVFCIGAPSSRLQVALAVGADAILDFSVTSEEDRLQWVNDHTNGRGADVTIEATGNAAAVVGAMEYTRASGRVVILGQYADTGQVALNPHIHINKKHLTVKGCWGADFSHYYKAANLILSPQHGKSWCAIPTKIFGLHKADFALEEVAVGAPYKVLIDPWRTT